MSLKQKKSKFPSKLREINLEKICRCCLSDKATLKDVINTKLPPMLEFCTSIELLGNDELPKQICVECLRLITKFYVFKKKVLKCNALLQSLVRKRLKEKLFKDILDKAVSEADIQDRFLDYKSDDGSIIINLDKLKSKSNVEEIYTTISLVEPPPLVPLDNSSKSLKTTNLEITSIKNNEQEDVDVNTPPPLVPLKKTNQNDDKSTEELVNEGRVEIICLTCKKSFDTTINLSEHKENCMKTIKLECNICHKPFNERKKLISHLKGHVRIKKTSNFLACNICSKKYANYSTLQVHIRRHTGERPFKCDICRKGFVRYAGLKEHMKTHSKIKPFECDICKRTFSFKSNLTRHRVLHSNRLPFSCNYCGKMFGQSDNLEAHIRTNHTLERPFLCSECGARFVSATRLKRHMWIHSGYKRYNCKQCNKSYTNSVDLKIHQKVHDPENSTEKPLSCHKCGKRFYLPSRLAKHMKVHEKPFNCDECDCSFFKEENLLKHKNRKHVVTLNSTSMACEVYVEENTVE